MNTSTLPAGKYVLLKLEDVEHITRMNEVTENLYIDVSGPDAEWLVNTVLDTQFHKTQLPNGAWRCHYNPPKPPLTVRTQVANAGKSLYDLKKTAELKVGSLNWVGSAFDGSEKDGLVIATDANHKKQMIVFEATKDLKIDVSTNSNGLAGLQIGTVSAKKPASRKRNSKGHFEKSEPVASAK